MTSGVLGYDANRDSGIAEARSYVEISKADLPEGLLASQQINPTCRVFAQLVYNVGATGQTDFNTSQVAKLQQLAENAEAIMGMLNLQMHTKDVVIPSGITTNDNNISMHQTKNKLMVARLNETGEPIAQYDTTQTSLGSIIADNDDIDGDRGTKHESLYIININGYVSSTECFTWLNQRGGTVSKLMDRFLPKITYIPYNQLTSGLQSIYPYGRSIIYLTADEYNYISEFQGHSITDNSGNKIIDLCNIIRIHYLTIPSANSVYISRNS
jgi:hypothetical protein